MVVLFTYPKVFFCKSALAAGDGTLDIAMYLQHVWDGWLWCSGGGVPIRYSSFVTPSPEAFGWNCQERLGNHEPAASVSVSTGESARHEGVKENKWKTFSSTVGSQNDSHSLTKVRKGYTCPTNSWSSIPSSGCSKVPSSSECMSGTPSGGYTACMFSSRSTAPSFNHYNKRAPTSNFVSGLGPLVEYANHQPPNIWWYMSCPLI